MDYAYDLFGGHAPLLRKFQVNASVAYVGVPLLAPGADNGGVVLATTTGAADMVGCNLDLATYATAQQTASADPAALVTLIIGPGAVWKALMSGGATEGTALSLRAVTTASTTGLAVTTAESWSSPTYDEGTVFGYDGANAGIVRKITSVSSTAGTVTVAFPNDTVVGDNFIRVPYNPLQTVTVQLTTNLYQADASIAVGTGAALRTVELQCRDQGQDGRTNSYVLFISDNHIFKD